MQKEPQRSFLFHWLANILFASIALFAGLLFGEKIPRDRLGVAFTAVAVVALLMVPLTRRWEQAGMAKRQRDRLEKSGMGPEKSPSSNSGTKADEPSASADTEEKEDQKPL